MKKITTIFIVFCAINQLSAQAPVGYYTPAIGKTGSALRIALHNIIKDHTEQTYGGLWTAYYTTDKKPGTSLVWDIYSDVPGGTAPYNFTLGSDQCSSSFPSDEGECYNREHTWPKSKYSSNMPMYTDLWIVYPTDAIVNGKRSTYPYGEITSPTWTSENNSKLGMNTYAGAPATLCFEPIDSFKGDIARSYFYVSTRYYSEDGGWSNWEMANGADLKPWAKQMLLEWHHMDPVSQKEIDRNNAVYAIQKNRNPFIDHPEMADCIFGTADCTGLLSIENGKIENEVEVFPNPATASLNIKLTNVNTSSWNFATKYIISDCLGKVYKEGLIKEKANTLDIQDLPKGLYFIQIFTAEKTMAEKFVKQ